MAKADKRALQGQVLRQGALPIAGNQQVEPVTVNGKASYFIVPLLTIILWFHWDYGLPEMAILPQAQDRQLSFGR